MLLDFLNNLLNLQLYFLLELLNLMLLYLNLHLDLILCVPILIKAANLFIYNYPNLLWPQQLKYTENQIEMLILKVLQIARLEDNL